MHIDDLILVSIDDHFIEPPDMYKNHVPAKWQDEVPKVVRSEQGVDGFATALVRRLGQAYAREPVEARMDDVVGRLTLEPA